MTETLPQHQFAIENATAADLDGIGEAHFQSLLETYADEAAGIDEAWIREHLKMYGEPNSEVRRKNLREAEADPRSALYLTVKNPEGRIVGFLHGTRTAEQARLEALYLIEEARGSGVGDDLMQRQLEFAGDLPIRLEVLSYNDRAIRFYEKYGFQKVPGSEGFHNEKLPVFAMERPVRTGTETPV